MSRKEKKFIPVMLTPFHPNGSIDYDGLTQLVEFYLEAGAGGLFANCQSSEMYHLKNEERIAIIRHVVKAVNGQVPVVAAGTFESEIKGQANFIKDIYNLGIEAAILITGMLVNEKEDDCLLRERFYQLLEDTEHIPLGFYECPVPYKRVLKPSLLAEFVASKRVIYHKDTSLDIMQVQEKIALTTDHSSFGLYDAYMVHAVESLKSGAAGLSCIQGNFFPELVVWLCQHYDQPDKQKEVALLQQFFIDHMDVMHMDYPITAKLYVKKKRGIAINSYARVMHAPSDNAIVEKIDHLEKEYWQICERLNLQE